MADLKPTTITGDENHANVTKVAGYCLVAGDALSANLRVATVNGDIVYPIEAAAGQMVSHFFGSDDRGPNRIPTPGGCYVQVVSGTIARGVLYTAV